MQLQDHNDLQHHFSFNYTYIWGITWQKSRVDDEQIQIGPLQTEIMHKPKGRIVMLRRCS